MALTKEHPYQLLALELTVRNMGYDVAFAQIPTTPYEEELPGYDIYLNSRKLLTVPSIEKRFKDTDLYITRFGWDNDLKLHYMHVRVVVLEAE